MSRCRILVRSNGFSVLEVPLVTSIVATLPAARLRARAADADAEVLKARIKPEGTHDDTPRPKRPEDESLSSHVEVNSLSWSCVLVMSRAYDEPDAKSFRLLERSD
jgi:hypothetical protein